MQPANDFQDTARGRTQFDLPGIAAPNSQPAACLTVAPPLAEALARGLLVLQYRADNLRVLPVFGMAALNLTPWIGHVHVTIDDQPWHWVDTSGQLIIQGLTPGPHRVLIELADPVHRAIDSVTTSFQIPNRRSP